MEDKYWQIIIENFAQLDLLQIVDWYELERNGLSNSFLDDFEEALNKIKRNPFYASKINERTRGASFNRFPYQIIYTIDAEKLKIYVLVITHQHRKPFWYKDRK